MSTLNDFSQNSWINQMKSFTDSSAEMALTLGGYQMESDDFELHSTIL